MNDRTPRSSPWLWEELEPGMSFAPREVAITAQDIALWREVSAGEGGDATVPGRALLVPLMMRCFIEASEPRLPGNIHVSQELCFTSRGPRAGERLVFTFTIGRRTERKGRGWVDILVDCRDAERGEKLMTGRMVLIWAGRRVGEAVTHV